VKESDSDSRRETEPENIIQLMMLGCAKNLSSFDSSQPEDSESVSSINFENMKIPQKNIIKVHAIYLFVYLFHFYNIQNKLLSVSSSQLEEFKLN
jgi:hypothetical protein